MVAGARQPGLAVRTDPTLDQLPGRVQGDEDTPERETAVQVGPQREQRHIGEECPSRGVLQQLEQHDHEQHGEEVGAREPVGGAQHRRRHAHEVGQQRIAALAEEEPRHAERK